MLHVKCHTGWLHDVLDVTWLVTWCTECHMTGRTMHWMSHDWSHDALNVTWLVTWCTKCHMTSHTRHWMSHDWSHDVLNVTWHWMSHDWSHDVLKHDRLNVTWLVTCTKCHMTDWMSHDWSHDVLKVTWLVPDGPRECLPIVFSGTSGDVREKICHPLHWEVVFLRVTEQVEQSCDEHNLWKKGNTNERKKAVECEKERMRTNILENKAWLHQHCVSMYIAYTCTIT